MATFEVVENPETARLVRFSIGKLNPEAKKHLEFKCFTESHPKKRKMSVTTELNKIKFSGENYGVSGHTASGMCDYYVAIHRKGADKVQILPADIFQLKPVFEDVAEQKIEKVADLSFSEKRAILAKQFGSGQLRRSVTRSEKQKLEEDMVTATTKSMANKFSQKLNALVDTSVEKVLEGDSSISEKSPASSTTIPYNKDATIPDDVYPLDSIIPSFLWNPLREQSQVFMMCVADDIKAWRETKKYPGIVLDGLENLPLDVEQRQWWCSCLMYLRCLVHVYLMNNQSFKRKSNNRYPEDWKGLVKKQMDETFTVVSTDLKGKILTARPSQKKALNLQHILVLYSHLCHHSIRLAALRIDLKTPVNRLTIHAQMLGFTISRHKSEQSTDTYAKLSLPLKFPILKPKSITNKRTR